MEFGCMAFGELWFTWAWRWRFGVWWSAEGVFYT